MNGWAIAITQPNSEAKVTDNAKRQGFDCWYPRLKTIKRFAGKRFENIQPLFPRYIFIVIQGAWRSLSSTVGISDVLMSGHDQYGTPRPAILPDSMINQIKGRCDAAGFYQIPLPPKFKQGQAVRVVAGPFYGFTGRFHELKGEDRSIVLLKMLGQEVRTNVAECDLAAA